MAFENLKKSGIAYLLGKLKDIFLQIKDAVHSVNGEEPDANGNINIRTVPYAQNLESELSQRNGGTFIMRTAGGTSSIENGDAWLMNIKGNSDHDGYVPEVLTMTVSPVESEEREGTITAEIDRDTFVAYVDESGTTNLIYTTDWSADPSLYGVTVTGTPYSGDVISIVYVKEERGTITVADPQKMIGTGWNLYNHSTGYARAVKYSDDYGFRVEGTYTGLQFSSTISGTRYAISPVDGAFDVPSDGFIWVAGGNSTDTAVYMTWSDWTEGYEGEFASYTESEVDFSSVMSEYFPNGLLKAGSVVDEIDFNIGQVISRVERLLYTAENRAAAESSGREFEFDENYIYLARSSAVTNSISVDGAVSVDDHGIEFFTETDIPVTAEMLYGNNLKNKLERDVLTKSQDLINNLTTNDATKALTAAQGYLLNGNLATVSSNVTAVSGRMMKGKYTNYGLTLTAERVDDIVMVSVQGTLSSNLSSWAHVITNIDHNFAPPSDFTLIGSTGVFYMELAGRLRTNGSISSGADVRVCGIYRSSQAS